MRCKAGVFLFVGLHNAERNFKVRQSGQKIKIDSPPNKCFEKKKTKVFFVLFFHGSVFVVVEEYFLVLFPSKCGFFFYLYHAG